MAGAAVVVLGLAVVVVRTRVPQADLRVIAGQNVLLVTIDTLRADALGSYGGKAATPALDLLASEGVRFDFAHAHAVLTLPSHGSILTGEYPFRHGLRDNSGYRLPAEARTVATILKQAGYATAAYVSAYPLWPRFGLTSGFDVYDGGVTEKVAPADFGMPERPASETVPLARGWIAERSATAEARPWFVWLHVFDPHAPYRPPAPFNTQYAARPYDGEVAATDAALAPLLEDLRRSTRPTLVIVTGDHGEGLGDHGEAAHGIFAYESTLRVPLIIAEIGGGAASPPATGGGEVSGVAARHVDILPTILDAVGQGVPADLPGRTLLPRGERTAGAPPRATYFEAMSGMLNHGWAPLSGVIVARDKFIDLPIPERYDLAADAAERSNLAGRVPERDRMLAASLAGFGASRPGRRAREDEGAADRLRALGYVAGDAPLKSTYTEDDDPKRLVEFDSAIHEAIAGYDAGRREDATRIYGQIIARRPGLAIAYRHLAFIEWQAGRPDEAIAVLRRAIAAGATGPRVVAQLGTYLADTGHVAEGIRLLEPLARNPAADAEVLNPLGIAYARAGHVEEARRVFERMRGLMPGSSVPFENLGVLALDQGDIAGARTYFDRAISVWPGSSRAHAGAAAAALRAGDRQAAIASWTRAVQIDPTNVDALYSLGLNLAQDGRLEAARPYLEAFLRAADPHAYAAQRQAVLRLLQSIR